MRVYNEYTSYSSVAAETPISCTLTRLSCRLSIRIYFYVCDVGSQFAVSLYTVRTMLLESGLFGQSFSTR